LFADLKAEMKNMSKEENLLGKRDEFDIEAAVEYMQHYWKTYPKQPGYENYSENMFLRDALYGVGVAIDNDKYSMGNGFIVFIKDLAKRVFTDTLKGKRIL